MILRVLRGHGSPPTHMPQAYPSRRRLSPLGKRRVYSNRGFDILGEVVAEVDRGRSVDQTVFDPPEWVPRGHPR